MSRLRNLVLYRERAYVDRDLNLPSIEENLNVLSPECASEIAGYLENGLLLLVFVSNTEDPYMGDKVLHAIYSDGVYAWDGVIAHWVRKYRIRLPEEFISHYERVKKMPLPVSKDDVGELLDAYKMAEKVFVTAT